MTSLGGPADDRPIALDDDQIVIDEHTCDRVSAIEADGSQLADPAARRLPMGNLAFWGLGCLVALPFARPIAEALWTIDPDPTTAVVNFQTALHPKQRFLLGLLPE